MFKRRFYYLFLVCAILYSCATLASDNKQQVVWVDVRSWAENKFNGIEGDLHIPYQNIIDDIKQHVADKNVPIRLYCERGVRADKALQSLRADGYTNIENAGGISDVRHLRFSDD